MGVQPVTPADEELIEAAAAVIRERYRPGTERRSRTVGAALRTEDGAVYTGVNLVTDVGRARVCAEPVAIGRAVTEGEEAFDAIVAVKHDPAADPRAVGDNEGRESRIIAACGVCRELIRDYDPTADVILPGEDGPVKRPANELLPDLEWRGDDGD